MKDMTSGLYSFKLAVKAYYAITGFALLYHFLILTRVVDYKNAWGGRLESLDQMYRYEGISIMLQLLFAGAIFIKQHSVKVGRKSVGLTALLLIISIIFFLNTLGNIFAISPIERILFTPLTLIAALAAIRIAFEPPIKANLRSDL